MSWHRASILVLAAGFWIASCKGEQSSTDGNTSWLRHCDDATPCGGGFECLCGMCTRSCSDSAACRDLDPNATCAPGGAACPASSVCTLACDRRDDCTTRNAALECIGGACELQSIARQEAGSTGGSPAASGGGPTGTGGSTGGAAGGTGGTAGADGGIEAAASGAGGASETGGAATGGATSQPTDAGVRDGSVPADSSVVTRDAASDATLSDAIVDAPLDRCSIRNPTNKSTGVLVRWVPFDLPTGSGGTITSGIYVLTDYVEYLGPDGGTGTGTSKYWETIDVNVAGSTATVDVFFAPGSLVAGTFGDWDWTISGNTIVLAQACTDSMGPISITYTATPDELRLYWGGYERVFTRL